MTRSREEMELDLPFLVNGTLSDAERAELEFLLAEDPQLAAERDALAVIRAEMQAEDIGSPGEFGLARLMRDVDRETAAAPVAPASTVARFPGRNRMWQAVAAVAVIGLVAQAYFVRPPANVEINVAPAGYVMAGAESAGALLVAFRPGATEAQIRDLLLRAELEIVAGPSSLGLYRLDVLDGAALDAAARSLRAADDIVESVENVQN
ncbi:hypothetical protein [Pararhodobacter sp. CCB-MM2]|uniref:hypothetical protein n=1 Tax=Pararhodobacter sp. CCB-MM2 TaxID=1786003 RepID=UPI00082BB614|nr:hypothetical protein [Pararhodobacter sp. CCB-MM2]MCA2012989.1 hypothetical protein [Cereibacter sphaeroides]